MKISRDRHHSVTYFPVRQPSGCRGRVREKARLEWWVGDPGEPVRLLTDLLARHGLPVTELADMPDGECGPAGTVCGAAVLISAGACNLIAGRPVGPATPAPGVPDLVAVVYEHLSHPVAPPPHPPHGASQGHRWRPSWSTRRHAAAIEEVRRAIGQGDVYQVNVVGHWSAVHRGDPTPVLAAVTRLPGARYAGMLTGDGWAVACGSPEALLSVARGAIETRPIKGTRPATPAGRAELLASEKERAEHIMIVDLERNDLSRVARTGSVRVADLFAIRRWCQLWQAESVVRGELAPGIGLADVLTALCPGGSVTGAPKLAAIDQIAGLEPVGRGPSMGAFGYLTPYRIDLGLTIRTVASDAGRLHLWAGGGITWSSDPDSEVAEAAAKARPLMAALKAAAGTVREPGGPRPAAL